ncbi:MAG: GH25 family lysozyme [Bilifractor sp.]
MVKKRWTKIVTAGILSAVLCFSSVPAAFAEDQPISSSSRIENQEEAGSPDQRTQTNGQDSFGQDFSEQNASRQNASGQNASGQNASGQDSFDPEETETVTSSSDSSDNIEKKDQQNTEDTSSRDDDASQVSSDIEDLVKAAAQISDYSTEQAGQISQQIAQTQNALDSLSEEEQDILSGSKEALENAAKAVDDYQNPEVEGHFLAADDGHQNSFRYINGQPVSEALQQVSQESDAIDAYADGESDTIVQGLKNGTVTKNTAESSALKNNGAGGSDSQAVLLGTGNVSEGIDVSHWQGTINWEAVRNSGVQFAMLSCGFGDDLSNQDDSKFIYNAEQCEKYGIPYGVYLYSYAIDAAGGRREANHALRLLKGRNVSLPVYIDLEENNLRKLGASAVTSVASEFCSIIFSAGYQAGIYSSTSWWNSVLAPLAHDTSWSHWVAEWKSDEVHANADWQMWQYSAEGSVSGISGDVDMDRWYGDMGYAQPATSDGTGVRYQTHVQNIGWQNPRYNGITSGTTGQDLRMEAIRIGITGNSNVGISYSVHVQNIGWMNSVSDWADGGTTGQGLRIEAIRISLTGADASKYDIYYRAHVQNIGWMGWAKNGESAGTEEYKYRMEAIQIVLTDKGAQAPSSNDSAVSDAFRVKSIHISYNSHVQNIGWMDSVDDGETSGTTGKGLRMEAISISSPVADLQYRTHVQNIGWQDGWTDEGEASGTTGRDLQMEAIQILLTGDSASQYDVYYRVHVQNIGWTGWAKNGESAGSTGYSYRMEAIQIVLVNKGGAAPGSTAGAYYQR